VPQGHSISLLYIKLTLVGVLSADGIIIFVHKTASSMQILFGPSLMMAYVQLSSAISSAEDMRAFGMIRG
jgi:hypothetical protein